LPITSMVIAVDPERIAGKPAGSAIPLRSFSGKNSAPAGPEGRKLFCVFFLPLLSYNKLAVCGKEAGPDVSG